MTSDVGTIDASPEEIAARAMRVVDTMPPKDIAELSLSFFAAYYLSEHLKVPTPEGDRPCPFSEAHENLMAELQSMHGGQRKLFLFPRGHGKTTIADFVFILWCICYRHKRNIVLCSDEQNQAKEFLRNIKAELLTNEAILEDFGDLSGDKRKGGKWDETWVITDNHVQIKIKTPGMNARGMNYSVMESRRRPDGRLEHFRQLIRPDLMIFDDILNSKHVQNKENRDKLENWLFQDMMNALDPYRGDILIIGTLLHNDDLLSRIWKDQERTSGWVKVKSPACTFDASGNMHNVLWPSYWSEERLKRRRYEIGSLAFAQEFLLQPVDEGAKLFSKDWLRYYCDLNLPATVQLEWRDKYGLSIVPDDLICVTSIDPAAKEKDTSDYTVVATVGYSPSTNNYYVLDMFRERCSPDMYITEMLKQKYRWDKFLQRKRHPEGSISGFLHRGFSVETYAYQATLMYWLRRYCTANGLGHVKVFAREEQGMDKALRCGEMSPMVEQRRLYFPVGITQDFDNRWIVNQPYLWLEEELADFPHGAYDDGVDALHRCYSILKRDEKRYNPATPPPPTEHEIRSLWEDMVTNFPVQELDLYADPPDTVPAVA
jgi:phage terminase large subunit-like protein